MTAGPAMTRAEALRAVATGIDLAGALWADGLDLLGVGEMGIGNTTAASAICAVLTDRPVALVTGRGTGIDDATHRRKIAAIERALAVNGPDPTRPDRRPGGRRRPRDRAARRGHRRRRGGAHPGRPRRLHHRRRRPASRPRSQPAIAPRLIAAHRSIEPGHAVILEHLDRRPLLDLDLRLGEGTGAALAMGVIAAAVRLRDGMATFESAAISGPTAEAHVGESEPA